MEDIIERLTAERDRMLSMAEKYNQFIQDLTSYTPQLNGNGTVPPQPVATARRGHHVLSAAARRKIAAAQRARWAKVRAQKK